MDVQVNWPQIATEGTPCNHSKVGDPVTKDLSTATCVVDQCAQKQQLTCTDEINLGDGCESENQPDMITVWPTQIRLPV